MLLMKRSTKGFKFGGRVNRFTKIPLEDLKQEFKEYKLHFYEFLAQEQPNKPVNSGA